MLRAIGAQIEKTTNREACRDLTGRRLRDINEEKRIKEWIKKEKLRKEEMEERRRQKLERLKQQTQSQPKTLFNDPDFERTREEIPDIVDEALQYGLQLQQKAGQSSSSSSATKRKADQQFNANNKQKKKKVSLWIGSDIDIEDDDSDDNNEGQTSDAINSENQTNKDDNTNDSEVTTDSTIESKQSEDKPNSESEEVICQQTDQKTEESEDSKQCSESIPSEPIIKETNDDNDRGNTISESNEKKQVFEPLNLMDFKCVEELESLGLDPLKHSLMALGLKCGGTLNERANRLWSIRGLDVKDIPKKLFAKKK